MNFKNLKFAFFLIIGIFIFKWVYDFFAGPESINLIILNKDKIFLLVLAHLPTLYFDSLTWIVLLGKEKLSLTWAVIITWIAQASGKFLPTGNITGEFVRVYLGIKKGLTNHESTSSVFADLIIATFSLFLISFLSFIFVISKNTDLQNFNYYLHLVISLILIFSASFLFYWLIRSRILKVLLKKSKNFNKFKFKKSLSFSIIKTDLSLYFLSRKQKVIFKAIILRSLGWLAGAFEIYIFLWIIGIEASVMDVIIIESFSGIIRAIAFFMPAGLGVQELSFVIIGEFVGYSGSISFAIALGRRIRELLVGIPAIISWMIIFKSKN